MKFTSPDAANVPLPIPDDARTIAEAVETAKRADVAILALGENTDWMEGEASSRTTLGFTGAQQQLLEAVVATGKPVILVVLAGRPLGTEVGRQSRAGDPGGVESPASRPAMPWPMFCSATQIPPENCPSACPAPWARSRSTTPNCPPAVPRMATWGHLPRDKGEKFMSRYLDEENSALFPFGWGLSYTRFSYSQPSIDRSQVPVREALHNP